MVCYLLPILSNIGLDALESNLENLVLALKA
jgi:hypothetical protein